MAKPRLFIVVSTGQNLANLPPILEYAKQGDAVLWVESLDAQRQRWSAGAREVLERYGLTNLPQSVPVEDINDPVQIAQALDSPLQSMKELYQLVFVANGGKKLAPVGLLGACKHDQPTLLYGDDKPVALWIFEQGLELSPKKQPYRCHHLDLEDILKTYGQQLMGPPPLKLWPENLATSGAIRYGTDSEYTFRLHQEHHDWGSFGSTETCGVDFKDIDRLIQDGVLRPDTLTTWKNAGVSQASNGAIR